VTVIELIELLEGCDPDAEVRIMSQEGWPFENAIRGVCVREDIADEDDGCECDHRITGPHEEGCPAGEEREYPDGTAANDVFIVEGQQERYGNKGAWDLV
jgi:hypothetical protein